MTALAETQARIASIRKLRTVVGAMRGIAAAHTQQARAALKGYRSYAQVIANGLAQAAELAAAQPDVSPPARSTGAAVVVFTAEHGLAGAFSERVLNAVAAGEASSLYVAGTRGLAQAELRGWRPAWTAPMASQASGVEAVARRLAAALYAGLAARKFASVDVVFCKPSGAMQSAIERRSVLPVDLKGLRAASPAPAPLINLPPRQLLEHLIGEHVFAQLALAALESFASENAARLATMEAARLNIEQKLDDLSALERLLRQEQITAEVQEVTSGALAAPA